MSADTNMGFLSLLITLLLCSHLAEFADPPCVIELECRECIPDNMPLVRSHRAADGAVTVRSGDELVLACSGGRFLAFPLLETLTTICDSGLYKVKNTGDVKHLLELGCQENIFEDVLHQVDDCGAPWQGRAYRMREPGGGARLLAVLCFDEDRVIALRLRLSNVARDRSEPSPRMAPLSLLGNFNQMFDARSRRDAERLYSNDAMMNGRLHEIFKHDRLTFVGQTLTSAELLSRRYFDDQNGRISEFVSNRVAVWGSVAHGNLRHLHRDVAKLLEVTRLHEKLEVYAGTHAVLSMRSGHARKHVYLEGGNRFPVPKYIWTVVHNERREQAIAIVVLNDPFVAVSEIAEAVFCESACGGVAWLHELRWNRNYETPINGLVFCCSLHNFTRIVKEMPGDRLTVRDGVRGMLTNLFPD